MLRSVGSVLRRGVDGEVFGKAWERLALDLVTQVTPILHDPPHPAVVTGVVTLAQTTPPPLVRVTVFNCTVSLFADRI